MSDDVIRALATLAGRLLRLATEDGPVREDLRRLADALLATPTPPPEPPPTPAPPSAPVPVPDSPREPAPADGLPREPLPELTLGRTLPRSNPRIDYAPEWMPDGPAAIHLNKVAERCHLKAEAARYMSRRLHGDDAGHGATEADLIERAKQLDPCFLWMLKDPPEVAKSAYLGFETAGCYEALALAVRLADEADHASDVPTPEWTGILELMAESQSALRAALAHLGIAKDQDQLDAYDWLRTATKNHRIYLRRYMREADRAKPENWYELTTRIKSQAERFHQVRGHVKKQRKRLSNLEYKLSKLTPASADADWLAIAGLVHELVQDGLPPSNVKLRDLLLPALDTLPELPELPAGFEKVLHALDEYQRTLPEPAPSAEEVASEQVRQAAALLRGRALVLIGGDRRPEPEARLIQALELSDLYWVETRAHDSIGGFEAWVARPDVAAVLLAIRWASHSYGEVLKFCKKHGKPLVRLKAGYNPNQVAVQLLAQCSHRLATAPAVR